MTMQIDTYQRVPLQKKLDKLPALSFYCSHPTGRPVIQLQSSKDVLHGTAIHPEPSLVVAHSQINGRGTFAMSKNG